MTPNMTPNTRRLRSSYMGSHSAHSIMGTDSAAPPSSPVPSPLGDRPPPGTPGGGILPTFSDGPQVLHACAH